MKKLNIIFALMISSFFLLSSNVRADTYNYTFNESDFDYLTEDFYKIRDMAIEYANNNDCYYMIEKPNANYYVLYFNTNDVREHSFTPGSRAVFRIYPQTGKSLYRYLYRDNELQLLNTINDYTSFMFEFSNNILLYTSFLDSNYDFYLNNNVINFSYKDTNYTIDSDNPIPTLYDIYLNENPPQEEVDPKVEIISNFYILVIDKIKVFTNFIASDYIILSSLVIFIFVAVLGLVRRLE